MALKDQKCVPCSGDMPPLSQEKEDELSGKLDGWELIREGTHRIRKEYKLDSFSEAIAFVREVGRLAEQQDHHPDIHVYYRKVVLEFTTHKINGLSENDFIMADKVDQLMLIGAG